VITWDGRLDNPAELISELRDSLTVNSIDVTIIAAAYEKWGANCFAKLIGDWALSIWNPRERSVLLAKDPIGTRAIFTTLSTTISLLGAPSSIRSSGLRAKPSKSAKSTSPAGSLCFRPWI
jgi:asparagine synthetase B (glutamine-hydrolysing)